MSLYKVMRAIIFCSCSLLPPISRSKHHAQVSCAMFSCLHPAVGRIERQRFRCVTRSRRGAGSTSDEKFARETYYAGSSPSTQRSNTSSCEILVHPNCFHACFTVGCLAQWLTVPTAGALTATVTATQLLCFIKLRNYLCLA